MTNKKKTNRRYRLHQLIKHDFIYSARSKTIYVEGYKLYNNPYVLELQKDHGYSVQVVMPEWFK